MYGQRFLFGAWSGDHNEPDYLTWAGDVMEAKQNIGLLAEGREVRFVRYADLMEIGLSVSSNLHGMMEPVTNCFVFEGHERKIIFLG